MAVAIRASTNAPMVSTEGYGLQQMLAWFPRKDSDFGKCPCGFHGRELNPLTAKDVFGRVEEGNGW